ncbi:hypothetical protein [Bradyrhizobium sp. WD16]|uniref:hypothetical protein n=1 Tax=Bradyrhizobium sp. WD16 TaxID=1521768 RepID=UPI0020A5AC95|nr:hypothetical protein [Bradyrhizobium sp. WD16]UTD29299.1 hypothetical protein DB459_22705 [Bradyrhizobium sp. WD16]
MSRLTTTIMVLALVLVAPLGADIASAQNSGSGAGAASKSGAGLPSAPVGHRQPTRSSVSGGGIDTAAPPKALPGDIEDKALDRKIRSICKGC